MLLVGNAEQRRDIVILTAERLFIFVEFIKKVEFRAESNVQSLWDGRKMRKGSYAFCITILSK